MRLSYKIKRRFWKRKQEEPPTEKCGLVMYARNNQSQWYVDSGCSRHMTRDQKKFITLKEEKGGNVTFGDNGSARIVGRGIISLDNGRAKAQNVLYVEGLKHNLLSVIRCVIKVMISLFVLKNVK
jgi:hypothetical protein